jgi:phenylalanine-4-hydroxylase
MLHFIGRLMSLTRDLINIADPEQVLNGDRMFRPFMEYQKSWMKYFYPNDTLSYEQDSWFYLQKYMLPLIKQHASSYHVRGIHHLNLDHPQKPNFKDFQKLFYNVSKGFEIQPVNKEIKPLEYFSLIRHRKFPCIEKTRSLDELFCANEPDFWHEAIGHIAPLCFPEIQEFYLQIADYMLSAKSSTQFKKHLAVSWTLTEYGFIKEKEQTKMFGAALVGSHLANMRYLKGIINVERAERASIINSQFFEEHAPLARDDKGHLRFFCLEDLNLERLFIEN